MIAKYTIHKYIPIQEHVRSEPDFPREKSVKIIYLANLAMLLIQVIQLSAEWSMKSHEQISLEITNMDKMFPSRFMEFVPSATEASITMNLRTQIFIQMYLESLHEGGIDEWISMEKAKQIFQLDDEEDEERPSTNINRRKLTPEEEVFPSKGGRE
jgi:hypothetical protein